MKKQPNLETQIVAPTHIKSLLNKFPNVGARVIVVLMYNLGKPIKWTELVGTVTEKPFHDGYLDSNGWSCYKNEKSVECFKFGFRLYRDRKSVTLCVNDLFDTQEIPRNRSFADQQYLGLEMEDKTRLYELEVGK